LFSKLFSWYSNEVIIADLLGIFLLLIALILCLTPSLILCLRLAVTFEKSYLLALKLFRASCALFMFTSLNFNASGENTPSNRLGELDMNLPLLSPDLTFVGSDITYIS
jgi:hypothetical protein